VPGFFLNVEPEVFPMAKVSGPLMSMEAAGSFGKVRFRRGRGGRVVVYHDGAPGSVSRVGPSTKQQAVRSRYQEILASWRALTPIERQSWNDQAAQDERPVSGWNLYLAQNMAGINTAPDPALQLEGGGALLLEGAAGRLLFEEGNS
jgi:hypothetical protein